MPLIVSVALVIICRHGKLLLGQFNIFVGFGSLRIVLIAKIACKRAEFGSDNRSYVYYTWKYCHGTHENIIIKAGVAKHMAQGQSLARSLLLSIVTLSAYLWPNDAMLFSSP